MPKMKTHRGAAKRIKVTGTGRLKRRNAYISHMLEKKSPKRKRRLARQSDVDSTNAPTVRPRQINGSASAATSGAPLVTSSSRRLADPYSWA